MALARAVSPACGLKILRSSGRIVSRVPPPCMQASWAAFAVVPVPFLMLFLHDVHHPSWGVAALDSVLEDGTSIVANPNSGSP